ncbi:DNA mismatch repair protein MutL [Psychrobacter sp. PL15]|nr:DNA mismatch repair protein MutL [Psychrobacter sp. PL15]
MTFIMPDNTYSDTRIKKLSPLLINQLAAGEVVTRPSAVVKELLENAIDAGATDIEIRITQGGMGMIEVVDNGDGIHPDDMVMAITRHATSKVADIANLHGISTLGFRGEALAATAAVSRLTLTSSHNDSGIGRQLQVAGVLADTPKLTPVVHNQGTTITVKDLYFNVPARRGNLKSIGTEFAHIEIVVREVALARADVTLSLYHDQKKRLTLSATSVDSAVGSTAGSNENHLPLSRLEQALGLALVDNALEITVDLSSLLHESNISSDYPNKRATISGWLWPVTNEQSNQATSTSLPKLLYVNGRLVKEIAISNQLRQLATNAQLAGIGYALYFELPGHWLNINVHPTKQRIKISPLNNVMAHLSHVIALKLKKINTNTSQASIRAAPLDNHSHEAVSFKDTPLKDATSHQQVRAPQSQYQHSDKQQLLNKPLPEPSYFDINSTDNSSFDKENSLSSSTNDRPSAFSNSPLPHCLNVIDDVSQRYQATSAATIESDDQSSLPWLLFYSQGQCLLIDQQRWQENWQSVFKAKPESQTLGEQQCLEQALDKKNTVPASAAMINQQINSCAERMSTQQLIAFKETIEQALSTHAHFMLNTEQLLKAMLSNAST